MKGSPTAITASTPRSDEFPMTEEQKFFFDLKGWLLIAGVLEEDQIRELKEFLHLLKHEPERLDPEDRYGYGGPVAELHDHPAVVGVLRVILAPDINDHAYGFRLDGNYVQYRQPGSAGIDPHGGGPNVNANFSYQCKNQRIFSALTRVVWELNEVEKGNGGTLLMSGTHKANFAVPESHLIKKSGLFETYSCPPGSVLFFTENLCHSGADWQLPHPRIAIFNCYTHSQAQFHKMNWNAATVAEWPRKRQSLVRGVWGSDFSTKPATANDWYGADNRAY